MSAVMTKDELDELEALTNAATPGPWESTGVSIWGRNNVWVGELNFALSRQESLVTPRVSNDANFIVAAREAIPRLIARVRELEMEAEMLAYRTLNGIDNDD